MRTINENRKTESDIQENILLYFIILVTILLYFYKQFLDNDEI